MASCRTGKCEVSLMRCNIRSAHSTLRTARALDDPYELKLYSTDRRSTWQTVRIERTEFAFSGSLQCGCIGHGWGGGGRNSNLLLTERKGRTAEYWPEVVAVRTEHSEVRSKTTEGQYSPLRLELARLVRSLLYGTRPMLVLILPAFESKNYAA